MKVFNYDLQKPFLLFAVFSLMSFACKKERQKENEFPQSGVVNNSLAKTWVSYSDAYFGNSGITVYNPETGVWFFGQSDP